MQLRHGAAGRGHLVHCLLLFTLTCHCVATRPLKETGIEADTPPWKDVSPGHALVDDGTVASSLQFPANISGTYKGTWLVQGSNTSMRFPDLKKSSGNIIFQLRQVPTGKPEVHYVQGEIVLRDGMYISDGDLHMRLEGVYVRTFGELRMILGSSTDPELLEDDSVSRPTAYHLRLRAPAAPAPEPSVARELGERGGHGAWGTTGSTQEHPASEMQGVIESLRERSEGECFSPLVINATAVNLEVYYNKAVNYTLMVTFISFLQVLFIIRQMEHSNTQSVSLLMIGQQAIMDAYLCLLHLTAGIVVESLFNAFATAAFFKFVIFSIFEMRYLLAIWKARRVATAGEGWETMRRELSILYSRFYGFLLGGILVMYHLHGVINYLLLALYGFWVPQIVRSVAADARRPLHPHYILGISATRLAIPLYTFGCPRNFMRVEPNPAWCAGLALFVGAQAAVLLLQHYFGPRFFVPRQCLPEKYSYFRRVERAALQPTSPGEDGESQVVDCVICMAPVDLALRSSERMVHFYAFVTPCDHFFHTGCLQRWMDIKMECPTCRRPLPPL
eukprot:jgi/Mesen1/2995/ME000177S02273